MADAVLTRESPLVGRPAAGASPVQGESVDATAGGNSASPQPGTGAKAGASLESAADFRFEGASESSGEFDTGANWGTPKMANNGIAKSGTSNRIVAIDP